MKRLYVYIVMILTVIFWGASFVATKISLRELTPATIIVIRFSLGLGVLVAAVGLRGDFRPARRKDLPLLALLGFMGITFHQWLQVTGLKTATAIATAWVVATIPLFVALLGWSILGERLTKPRLGGIALAACGAITVVSGGNLLALTTGRVGKVGDVLIAVSALNWAVFTVLSKRALMSWKLNWSKDGTVRETPVGVMLYVIGFGWAFSLPWLAADGGWRDLAGLSGQGWLALVFLGIACSGLAYIFWYKALDFMAATQAGVFLYLQPLVTTALAGPLLGEMTTIATALGGAAVLLGVWLVNRR